MNMVAFRERVRGGQASNQPQVWGAGQLDEVMRWIDVCERLLVDVSVGNGDDRECQRTAKELLIELGGEA